jgi:hypothetical protein
MLTRSKSGVTRPAAARPTDRTMVKKPIRRVIPGETLRAEPRSDDEYTSDADSEGNLADFVVRDDAVQGGRYVDKAVDEAWKNWKPTRNSEARFKKVVDRHSKK